MNKSIRIEYILQSKKKKIHETYFLCYVYDE